MHLRYQAKVNTTFANSSDNRLGIATHIANYMENDLACQSNIDRKTLMVASILPATKNSNA